MLPLILKGQCTAVDSILQVYRNDADILAIRYVHDEALASKDSIAIDSIYADSMLSALVAVYQAQNIPERDTVVDLYQLHCFSWYSVNACALEADSSLAWVQNIKQGIYPCGQNVVDSLVDEHNLVYGNIHQYSFTNYAYIELQSNSGNINTLALAGLLGGETDIVSAYPVSFVGDGSDLAVDFYPGYREVHYSLKWGDCPAGCTQSRTWTFRVDDDCTVFFDRVRGNGLNFLRSRQKINQLDIFPQPVQHQLTIRKLRGGNQYNISNLLGQVAQQGQLLQNQSIDVRKLSKGIYLLEIQGLEGGHLFIKQ